jgi:hypothetical protein
MTIDFGKFLSPLIHGSVISGFPCFQLFQGRAPTSKAFNKVEFKESVQTNTFTENTHMNMFTLL